MLAFALFPNYFSVLWGGSNAASIPADVDIVQWNVTIEGMTCSGCAAIVQTELKKIPGVTAADINYDKGGGVVVGSPTIAADSLRKAVERAGFSLSKVEKITQNLESINE